jgi:hypothetical protein
MKEKRFRLSRTARRRGRTTESGIGILIGRRGGIHHAHGRIYIWLIYYGYVVIDAIEKHGRFHLQAPVAKADTGIYSGIAAWIQGRIPDPICAHPAESKVAFPGFRNSLGVPDTREEFEAAVRFIVEANVCMLRMVPFDPTGFGCRTFSPFLSAAATTFFA